MQTFFAYLKLTVDQRVLKVCRFHYQLEHIHPFVDGNGLMGSLWQTLLLMQYHPNISLSAGGGFHKANQDAFFRELAIGDDTGHCTGFVIIMLDLIRNALYKLISATRSV